MTEIEARRWIANKFGVSRETELATFVDLLREEASTQNLVAPSTLNQMWVRHVLDSAQLLGAAPTTNSWLDIGSGAGLPGLILAILSDARVELVEPRKLRTDFLERAVQALGLDNAQVVTAKVERTNGIVGAITARAVANLSQLFSIASHRASSSTIWVLPKGRSAQSEVEEARRAWHGTFHVEQSITAEDALIVVARGVRRK